MKKYQTTRETPIVNAILDLLVKNDYLVEYDQPVIVPRVIPSEIIEVGNEMAKNMVESLRNDIRTALANGMPIESNIEKMAKEILGVCEDRKLWLKELKAAVKEYGHDELIVSFEAWASSQGVYMGRKPVTQFLKNVGSHVGTVNRPAVSNTSLDKLETRIAYITNNTVFFTGDYRLKLAQLLKDNGNEMVESAFADFFQNVDDKSLPWAARDFLQRAQIMINTIKMKKQEAAKQEATLNHAYAAAANSVEEVEEEDEGL